MQSELADAKHELLKIQEMLEMTEKVILPTMLHYHDEKKNGLLVTIRAICTHYIMFINDSFIDCAVLLLLLNAFSNHLAD